MLKYFDYQILEELSNGKELSRIQLIFDTFISEVSNYLKLTPLYKDIIIKLHISEINTNKQLKSILDLGVKRIVQDDQLIVNIYNKSIRFLPFILLREAYYCFLPMIISKLIKICINQIVENDLSRLNASKEWKKLIRDVLVNEDFIYEQFDKLKKFFKIEAQEPFESTVQFFFKEVRKNVLFAKSSNIDRFYDLIYEKYSYEISKSMFNPEIVETLRVIIYIFYERKSYLYLSDYHSLFKKFKETNKLNSNLSSRKFIENLQWINNCSTISPSYDIVHNTIDLYQITCFLHFNPILERSKIKMLLEDWPFYNSLKFSENSFATDISLVFTIPKIYLKDLLNYFKRLKLFGYVIEKNIYITLKRTNFINLNYFTDFTNTRKIIDPNSKNYQKEYEIESKIDYSSVSYSLPLSLFDFILLGRIYYVSVTGLTFDKRSETLNSIKEDIDNELRKRTINNRDFKKNLDKLLNSPELAKSFLQFLEENQPFGFFYLYNKLNQVLSFLILTEKILSNNQKITNMNQLQKFLYTKNFSQIIEENILIRNLSIKKGIFHDFIPLYFQSKKNFREEVKKIQTFYNILNSCYKLKIFNIRDLRKIFQKSKSEDSYLAEKIDKIKKRGLKKSFKSITSHKITIEKIESRLDDFLNNDPPNIKPSLINTVFTSNFAKYYPIVILKDTPETHRNIDNLKRYFPRIIKFEVSDSITKENLVYVLIYTINIKEKEMFISLFYNIFQNSILNIKRYFWRGIQRLSRIQFKDFYDFENKQFFYTRDLFNELFISSQKILGKSLEWPKHNLNNNFQKISWSTKSSIDDLVNTVKNRFKNQKFALNLKELREITNFQKNLSDNLLNSSKILEIKKDKLFERYLNSIKIFPSFHKFGFSQYNLYYRLFHYKNTDFKLLFTNSFLKIKYPASIDTNQMIYSSYIFPYRTPNTSYLNWLIKSKKIISEYCLFHRKKFYEIIQFDRNLSKASWDYSSMRFKSYVQNVLFNLSYDQKIQNIREFDLDYITESDFYEPNSQEFNALSQIYNRHSIDIKSYLGTKKYTMINYITDLLKKKLIFPYLSLRNLDFQDKVSIILPNVKNEFNDKIIKIFSFFNMCHIYEIEGEFYIYGFEDIKTFENGFLIDIWFPKCEMDEFFEVFDLVFQYFEIKHYLILTDLIDGKNLLKSVYGNLEFLDSYNPLKNLIWNAQDKIWINHKLFNEKFEPIYPDLLYGENTKD